MPEIEFGIDKVSFWKHPISYLYQVLLVAFIGGRPVVVNVTIDPSSKGPLMYWVRWRKRPVVYNINLDPAPVHPLNPGPLITSNP